MIFHIVNWKKLWKLFVYANEQLVRWCRFQKLQKLLTDSRMSRRYFFLIPTII